MLPDLPDLLRDLIRLPSVNPMGRQQPEEIAWEHRVTDYLQDCFAGLGIPWQRQQVAPRRDNIVAWLPGNGPLLLLEVHQDTVPVDGMTVPPFEGLLEQERIYGRGACDVKGGMAAMLTAFGRLAQQDSRNRPCVALACSVNEEFGFSGATALSASWRGLLPPLLPQAPAAIIVAEPTELNVVASHKGVVRWTCTTRGRACHSSDPDRGANAVYAMARVALAIEALDQQLAQTLPADTLCGRSTVAATTIQGGLSANTVPDACSLQIDRRLAPDENPQEARQQVIDAVRAALPQGAEHADPQIASQGLAAAENRWLAKALRDVACEHVPQSLVTGAPYGTDAAALSVGGHATVVFGPGSIQQAHTADEWIALEQLQLAAEVYYQFASSDAWQTT